MKHYLVSIVFLGYVWFIMFTGYLAHTAIGDMMVLMGIAMIAGYIHNELFGQLYVKGVRVI